MKKERISYKSMEEQVRKKLSKEPLAGSLWRLYRHSTRGGDLEARFSVHGGYTSSEALKQLDKRFHLKVKREEYGHATYRLDNLQESLGEDLIAAMVWYKTQIEETIQKRWDTIAGRGVLVDYDDRTIQ